MDAKIPAPKVVVNIYQMEISILSATLARA